MTIDKILNSQAFFTIFMKNDVFFNSLKEKFPDILADLVSSRDNPNCSCRNRVRSYLSPKTVTEVVYFEDLLNNQEIKKLIEENKKDIEQSQSQIHYPMMPIVNQQNMFLTTGGRVFKIGKDEEDWKNLCKKIQNDKLLFRSFSILEKEDHLLIYFV